MGETVDWSLAPKWATHVYTYLNQLVWCNDTQYKFNLSDSGGFFGSCGELSIEYMTFIGERPKVTILKDSLTSIAILTNVLDIQSERAKEYEQAGGERSFERIANIFNAYKGTNLLPSDVALMLRILKEVRSEHSDKPHIDSFIDSTSYESLRCELRIKEKAGN